MQVKELKEQEMESIIGGGTISSSVINAIAKIIDTIYNLGNQTGSGIRRLTSGEYCPLN